MNDAAELQDGIRAGLRIAEKDSEEELYLRRALSASIRLHGECGRARLELRPHYSDCFHTSGLQSARQPIRFRCEPVPWV